MAESAQLPRGYMAEEIRKRAGERGQAASDCCAVRHALKQSDFVCFSAAVMGKRDGGAGADRVFHAAMRRKLKGADCDSDAHRLSAFPCQPRAHRQHSQIEECGEGRRKINRHFRHLPFLPNQYARQGRNSFAPCLVQQRGKCGNLLVRQSGKANDDGGGECGRAAVFGQTVQGNPKTGGAGDHFLF